MDGLRANVEAMPHLPAWRGFLTIVYCELEQMAEARAQLDVLRPTAFEFPHDRFWSSVIVNLSEASFHLRDVASAEVLLNLLRPISEQVGVLVGGVLCFGSFGYYAGLLASVLGRCEEAARHFEHALAMNERLGARPCNVRTRRAYATMLLDRGAAGDAARGVDLIDAGLADAEAIGMSTEVARLRALRERAG